MNLFEQDILDEPIVEAQECPVMRDYQNEAVEKTLAQLRIPDIRYTLNVMATGVGKSICIAELSRRVASWGHGVLVVVHRDELIDQLIEKHSSVGVIVLKEKAEHRALALFELVSNVVIASLQSMTPDRLSLWPRNAFRLLQIDEAHHFVVKSMYHQIAEHFETAKAVGWTATADRLDGKNIGQVFQSLAYEYNLKDGIRDRYLVPIESIVIHTDPAIDLSNLTVAAGKDLSNEQIQSAIQDNIGVLVNALLDKKVLGDRRTIAFTPDIQSARSLAYALNDVGITADWISGERKDRAEVIANHKAGKFQVLVNCMILTEGYDDPVVSCIIICRPTKSRALYSQMVGRGTRTWPGPGDKNLKPSCLVIDFAFITGELSLVSPVDLYDNANIPDEIVEGAKKYMKDGEETNIEAALERASSDFEENERVRIIRRSVQSRQSRFDLIGTCELLGIRQKDSMADWFQAREATPKQVDALRKWGVETGDKVPFILAQKILSTNALRAKFKLCTTKQINYMITLGMPPREARRKTFAQANEWLSEHAHKRG